MKRVENNTNFARIKRLIEHAEKKTAEEIRNNGGHIPDVVPEERILTPDEESIHRLNQINGLAESQE